LTNLECCNFYSHPRLQSCSLLICWHEDAGHLGPRVVDYINDKLSSSLFCEIKPDGFFHLAGVAVENDIAVFPESRFHICSEKNLVIFQSASPGAEWYKFINLLLDIVSTVGAVQEIYTVGGMVTLAAHTSKRALIATSNSVRMKNILSNYGVTQNLEYETPPGQRPTMSSYLLWIANRRNIPGASLWIPIPFYLLSVGDPRAQRAALDFLNKKFLLNMNLSDLDEEIHQQNLQIANVANQYPDLDELLHKLETNASLSEEENNRIIQIVNSNIRDR